MSTVEEIEAAIRSLTAGERGKLLRDLPDLFPELDGDMAWQNILHDARPRPAFSELIDRIESEYRCDAAVFPELQENDFDSHS